MIKLGDTIGLIALGGVCEQVTVEQAVCNIEALGYKVKLSKNIYDSNFYLAGADDLKIEELHNFFKDPEIKLILNARGGYGSIRLINKIDYEIIKANPKPFCGFSDITALLLMFYKKCGLVSFHGPMACSDFANIKNSCEIQNKMNDLLSVIDGEPLLFSGNKIYKDGSAEGILWGGNLSTVVSLCGQDFIPDEDFLFFAEDLNEPVYKIDRMFTQLFNITKFSNNCKGIVLGDFINVDNVSWLDALFNTFEIPTVGGFKISHSGESQVLPIGKKSFLKGKNLYF